jgi:tetratricopeptide (TPR) repeat protein
MDTGMGTARAAAPDRIRATAPAVLAAGSPTTREIAAKMPAGTRMIRPDIGTMILRAVPVRDRSATPNHRNHPNRLAHRAGKRLRISGSVILCGLALLSGERAWSASAEAMAQFDEANSAFEAENYSKARALFEQALAKGIDGPAIHYNIGAAAFRGGDLPRAERAFREVAELANTPTMLALAHYNLGLIAMQSHDTREARRWFERALDESSDKKLSGLATQRLAELPEPSGPAMWSYYSRGGLGYDDNVSLRSSSIESTATGVEDSYGELILAGSYSFGAWRIDASGGLLEYMSHDEFSQTVFSLGGARVFRLENWYFEVGAAGSQFSLGGEVFEQDVGVGGFASRMFYGGNRLRAQVRATRVDGKADFTGLTGDRMEFGVFYDKVLRSWTFGAHTRVEINDSEDPIFESRWIQLGAEARYAFSPVWGLTANAALRRIKHPAQSEIVAGWNDNRATLQLGFTRALWRQTQLFVRLEHERNDSPVVGYDYDRNWIAASIENWR